MTQAEYMQQRIDGQIQWMEGKSKYNQKMYKLVKLMEVIAAAAIPFLVGFHGMQFRSGSYSFYPFAILSGLFGVLIVILNGIQQLYKYHENWLTYRTTIESLKREKFLFESGTEPYNKDDAFHKFVQNCEALLTDENNRWKINWAQKNQTNASSS